MPTTPSGCSAGSCDSRPAERARRRADFSTPSYDPGDYLHVFERSGRRVTQRDLGFDAWHDWQAELAAKLEATIAFFYGNFVRGVRRAVIDGIEPAERPSESIQFELFEYIYHQILRKDSDWVARDLFRQSYRRTCRQRRRAPLRPAPRRLPAAVHLARNDARRPDRAAAGRWRPAGQRQHADLHGQDPRGNKLARGLFVAKHRGSAGSDEILTYRINDAGVTLD